jgi:hypothetical protein
MRQPGGVSVRNKAHEARAHAALARLAARRVEVTVVRDDLRAPVPLHLEDFSYFIYGTSIASPYLSLLDL